MSPELTSLWNHQSSGGGSATTVIAHAPELATIGLVRFFGGSPATAERAFFALVVALAAVGVSEFTSRLTAKPWVAALAAVLAIINPLFLTQTPNLIPFLAMGTTGILWALLLDASRGKFRPLATATASLLASYLSVNPPTLAAVAAAVVVVGIAIFLRPREASPQLLAGFFLRTGLLSLIFNLWWIVPTVLTLLDTNAGTSVAAQTNVLNYLFVYGHSSILNVLSGTAPWSWPHTEYFPWSARLDHTLLSPLRYVVPIAAIAAPFASRKTRRMWLKLLSGVTLLVFLSKGLHGPFGSVNLTLYKHIPYFYLFREPINKFGPIMVVLLAAAAAFTLTQIPAMGAARREKVALRASVGLLLLAVAAFSFPMFTGQVIPGVRGDLPADHVSVPAYWYNAANFINRTSTGKVLVLPLDDFYQVPTTWGYYGADAIAPSLIRRPVLQPLPGGYFSDDGVDSLETAVQNGLIQLAADTEAITKAQAIAPAVKAKRVSGRKAAAARAQAALAKSRILNVARARNSLTADQASVSQTLAELDVGTIVIRHDIDRAYPGRNFADDGTLNIGGQQLLDTKTTQLGALSVLQKTTAVPVVPESSGVLITSWHSVASGDISATISVGSGGGAVGLLESYAPGWQATINGGHSLLTGRHSVVDGYANEWVVPAGTYRVNFLYEPAKVSNDALSLSLAGIVIISAVAIWLRVTDNPRRRPRRTSLKLFRRLLGRRDANVGRSLA